MRKLTVVVTCSNRKSLPSDQALQARNLPAAGIEARSQLWCDQLARTDRATRPLSNLYRGEAWSVAGGLLEAARRVGFQPRLLVASAGLGLRHVTSTGPGYDATFAAGAEDAVGRDRDERRLWWETLRGAPAALEPSRYLRGSVMLVLSSSYADALHLDLVDLAALGGDALLVGGAVEVPGLARLPADRGLRHALGGTASSLNARMALRWLERLSRPVLTDDAAQAKWRVWANSARRNERWDRERMTDDEIIRYLQQLRRDCPALSATSALRALRTAGRACEQRRFANLFAMTRPGGQAL